MRGLGIQESFLKVSHSQGYFLPKCYSQRENGKFIVSERLDYLLYHAYYGNSKRNSKWFNNCPFINVNV